MRTLFLSILLAAHAALAWPQHSNEALNPSLTFGEPSDEELSFRTYQPDTTANAVCLLNLGRTCFAYNDRFQLITERKVRLKILNSQGTSHADVAVPYYCPEDELKEPDRIDEVKGCSYNLENGKRTVTPLAKEHMSDERINKYFRVLKFSLPSVKAGTVSEYQYTLHSEYAHLIDTWYMQMDIPVVFGQYDIAIPYMLAFDIEIRRKEYFDIKQKETNMRAAWYAGGAGYADMASVTCQQYIFTSHNLPAIKEQEPFCWCPDTYKAQIIFNMRGQYGANDELRSRSATWADIDKRLLNVENYDFGQLLTLPNPLREATKQAFASSMNLQQRIVSAFQVLRKHVAWDGTYGLYGSSFAKVLKRGTGNNAELNFILISILKDYGLNAYPAALTLRNVGILPPSFPALDKLNTFVVAVQDKENGRFVFVDSSMPFPAPSVLPLNLAVTRARLLSASIPEEKKWVNLLEQSPNVTFVQIDASMHDGNITGKRTTTFAGQEAIAYLELLNKANSGHEPEQQAATIAHKKVHRTPDDFTQIKEEADFSMKTEQVGERLYVNPMVFPHLTENPFLQSNRTLPIEFPYPYKYTVSCTLRLPNGYAVEEVPKPQLLRTDNQQFACRYMIEHKENTVTMTYMFDLKGYQFPAEDYKQLQDIWTKVIEKNNELLVLKKL